MNLAFYVVIAICIWNIITFSIYCIDKGKARKNRWRISETTLIICAFLMGSVGALLGMLVFHHKTKHLKFLLLLQFTVLLNIGITAYLIYHML